MTRDEERALEALEALGKSVRKSVRRARRVRDRLGDIGVRVLDEVVSQLSRRPVHTRSKDLFRRAQQLKDRVLETFPGPAPHVESSATGRERSIDDRGGRSDRPAGPDAGPPLQAESGQAPPRSPPPAPTARPAAEAPRPSARFGAPAPARDQGAGAPPSFVGLPRADARNAPDRPKRDEPAPAVATGRPGAALIADASGSEPGERGRGGDDLQLLARDPAWGYVSWEVALERIGAAAAGMSRAEARLEIREVEGGEPARAALDEPVAPARGRYFFRWPCSGRRYRATLYVVAADGRRVELSRSRDVRVPEASATVGPSARPEFGTPETAADRASASPAPPADRAAAVDLGWSVDPAPPAARPPAATGGSSWSGGASQLVPSSSWSGGASQLVPSSSWSGGASQLVPSSWSGAFGLFPTSWSGPSSGVASGARPSSHAASFGGLGSAPWSSRGSRPSEGPRLGAEARPSEGRPHGPRPGPVARIPELVAQTPPTAGSRLVPIDEAARLGLLDPE